MLEMIIDFFSGGVRMGDGDGEVGRWRLNLYKLGLE